MKLGKQYNTIVKTSVMTIRQGMFQINTEKVDFYVRYKVKCYFNLVDRNPAFIPQIN